LTEHAELELPVGVERLRLTNTTETFTRSSRSHATAAPQTTESPLTATSSGVGRNYVVLLTTLTIAATLVVVVCVVVAIATMMIKSPRRRDGKTTIELRQKATTNGGVSVQVDMGDLDGPVVHSLRHLPLTNLDGPGRPLKAVLTAENGVIERDAARRRLQLAAAQALSDSDVMVDDVGGPVVETGVCSVLDRSLEALSLIPGRDFNHEGPHRVYQWTDF